MLVDILRQADIPAYARRHSSGDVPEMMAAGPHEVVVPEDRAADAHALVDPIEEDPQGTS
jgi:hypothetical protein